MRGGTDNPTDIRYELVPESTPETLIADPLAFTRRHLRGRVSLVILLALLLGGTFATMAYMFSPVTWQSTGRIRVSAGQPTVLYGSGRIESQMGMKNFAQAQAMLVSSREVAQRAVESPRMQQVGWPQTEQGIQTLQASLHVALQGSEQFISIAALNSDPIVATAAVDSVLDAYLEIYKEYEHVSPEELKIRLADRQVALEAQLAELREQLLAATDQYGLEALEQMHNRKVEELIAVDQKLSEITIAATAMEAAMAGDANAVVPGAAMFMTPRSSTSDALHEREQTLVAEIESWRDRYGPAHPMIRELTRQLEAVRIRLDLRDALASTAVEGTEATASGGSQGGAQLDRLRMTEQAYLNSRNMLRSEASTLGLRLAQARGVSEHIEETRSQLADTRHRLDALRVEHTAGDDAMLVRVDSRATVPTSPIKDRRVGMAGSAGLLGVVLALAIVLLIGVVDPRCRYVSDLTGHIAETPVLAVIPDVGGRSEVLRSRSALAVHQLRNLLQLDARGDACPVIAITSGGESEGKTSLSLALGASFASAGTRTLLVDGDVSHGGLSHEAGLDHLPGLYQGLGLDGSGGEIHRTRTENLWVLPVGVHGGFDPRLVSCQRLQRLIDSLRGQFDAIIIDTGSLLTSLSGSVACAIADQTVMVATRYQHARLIDSAMERLAEAHANVAGLVFNRASARDLPGHDMHTGMEREAAMLVPDARTGPVTTIGKTESYTTQAVVERAA